MNLSDLLCNSPEKLEALEKLSDKALFDSLAPYFKTTRPDPTKRQAKKLAEVTVGNNRIKKNKAPSIDELLAKLDKCGL